MKSNKLENVQNVDLPPELCSKLLEIVRKNADKFQKINQEEEPPLRTLDHGLYGEYVELSPADKDPYPYVLRRPDGKCYHGFRFDQAICDEAAQNTKFLNEICGSSDPNSDSSFRQILTYSKSSNNSNLDVPQDIRDSLTKLLLPAALKVFGENENEEAMQASHLFSIYTNFCAPGHNIKLHLDVPQFRGIDRSTSPSWLLIAAKCSGLFKDYQVRNVTCVLYPQDANGGEIVIYEDGVEGKVFPVKAGTSAILDADSMYHQVLQVRRHGEPRLSSAIPKAPDLPTHCRLKVQVINPMQYEEWHIKSKFKSVSVSDAPPFIKVEENKKNVWTIEDMEGNPVIEYGEEDIRFSISCKFHIFKNMKEREQFNDSSLVLPATKVIEDLKRDLISKNKLKDENIKLFDLAPILVKEYILPFSPTSDVIEKVLSNAF